MKCPVTLFKTAISDHSGTGHKIFHNFTTLANIPLAIWLICSVIELRDANFQAFELWIKNPLNIIASILFVAIALRHFTLEIEVVIEDYVSNVKKRNGLIKAMNLFALLLGGVTIISILKVSLG